MSATVPNCISYDPTFGYELAVIVQDGLRRMYAEQEDIFYYISVMNENYDQPPMPEGVEQDILKGMYLYHSGISRKKTPKVLLLGSGTIFCEVIAAADILKDEWGVEADLWSCPSFTELAREGQSVKRWNRLHPTAKARVAHVEKCITKADIPVIAATDYMRAFAEQIRPYINADYTVLGTDGFGRSDTREQLRSFFEVDRYHITIAALKSLADKGEFDTAKIDEAIAKYNINPEIIAPWLI
jgi:pyruvate dehydrogenase E1 component